MPCQGPLPSVTQEQVNSKSTIFLVDLAVWYPTVVHQLRRPRAVSTHHTYFTHKKLTLHLRSTHLSLSEIRHSVRKWLQWTLCLKLHSPWLNLARVVVSEQFQAKSQLCSCQLQNLSKLNDRCCFWSQSFQEAVEKSLNFATPLYETPTHLLYSDCVFGCCSVPVLNLVALIISVS